MINVTDNTPQIFHNIETVQSHGGNGMLINYLPQGLTIVKQIAEDPSVKIPIQMHMDFAGVWYEDPWSGVTSKLTLGKLPDWLVEMLLFFLHLMEKHQWFQRDLFKMSWSAYILYLI